MERYDYRYPEGLARCPGRPCTSDLPTRIRRILIVALPIVGGMASQTVLNLVDTGMVGQLNSDALAAVGLFHIWLVNMLSRLVQAALFAGIWWRARVTV